MIVQGALIFAGIFTFLFPQKVKAGADKAAKMFGPFQVFGPPNPAHIENVAFGLAKQNLVKHEGRRNDVYIDSLGYATVGIGHKVVPADGLRVGQTITDAKIDLLFSQDIAVAFKAAKKQTIELGKYDAALIAALTEVNFQLGTGWTKTFSNTWKLIKSGNVDQAIRNLNQSAWKKQTPVRVAAFVNVLENVYG